jgi:ABC-type dipeptide/oligopeptide/nickel transport system permease subunit
MRIEDSAQSPNPRQMEPLDTVGAIGEMPPNSATIKDLGPASDTPTQLNQSELDRRAMIQDEEPSLSPFRLSMRRLRRNKRAMISLAIVLFMIIGSFVFPPIYLHLGPTISGGPAGLDKVSPSQYHNYTNQQLLYIDSPGSAAYPLGADGLGRDILARLMAGINVSIEVAFLVAIFDVGLGLLVGTLAGFFGGWMDTFLARFTDIMFAFPGLLFAILAAATLGAAFSDKFGPPGRLILVSLAIGITIWPQMARYVRGYTLQLKEQQFVEAARTVGTANHSIILRHIVPNLFSIVVAAVTLDIVGVIIGEATISLLGLGVQPPGSSLGLMIYDGSRKITSAPTEVLWPTLTLAILVIAFAFLGDGINDAFNPRSKD